MPKKVDLFQVQVAILW